MPTCSECGATITSQELEKDELGAAATADFTLYNFMQGLAMQCDCGEWLCSSCAEQAATRLGPGAIQQHECGGVFRSPH